jgi:all-trans-8'-apo-beta-carotenal 15,15'-oxygenase
MQSVATRNFAPYLERAFTRDVPELTCRVDNIRGILPTFLRGTHYLNGPAKFRWADGFQYRNWLDGDGMVCALRLTRDGVFFRSRYVHGRKFIRESEQGQPVFRSFGTAFEGDRLKRGIGTESPYNVSVFRYQERLLAFGEQSLPMELDTATLETINPGQTFDFHRLLNDSAPFSAHPKIDYRTGELINFGIFFAPQHPLLIFYRFNRAGSLACHVRVPIDLPCSLHDFAISPNFVIFYLSPYILDTSGLTERGLATIDSLSWEPDYGSQLLILHRHTGEEFARLPINGRYCLHTVNAFEEDRRLVVDVIDFDRPIYDQYQNLPELFVDVPSGQPVRFQVDLTTRSIVDQRTIPYRSAPDFPAVDARLESQAYDELWMLGISAAGRHGRKFFDQLVHARWSRPGELDIWTCPRGQYLGSEPVFVADPTENCRGVVICHVFDAIQMESSFALFNADDVRAGPRAVLRLPQPIHLGFHACFCPDVEPAPSRS